MTEPAANLNEAVLTDREREYFYSEVPILTTAETLKGLTAGFLIGLLQAAFSPGNDKGDRKLMETARLIRYTRYKKAVLRKASGAPKKGDEKLLLKLNKNPFVLEKETFDADAFTAQIYEEYMEKHR
jgi:hypothetical protein